MVRLIGRVGRLPVKDEMKESGMAKPAGGKSGTSLEENVLLPGGETRREVKKLDTTGGAIQADRGGAVGELTNPQRTERVFGGTDNATVTLSNLKTTTLGGDIGQSHQKSLFGEQKDKAVPEVNPGVSDSSATQGQMNPKEAKRTVMKSSQPLSVYGKEGEELQQVIAKHAGAGAVSYTHLTLPTICSV